MPPVASAQTSLRTYETKYYIIHSDLDEDAIREVIVRVTAMAEEYHRRTKAFRGSIRQKLPLFLFRKRQDYHSAGGPAGSAGVFTGGKLMVAAGQRVSERTWRVLQHEGFHQFARFVIGGHIPVWVNEGMAEYFGQAVFTGDGFITGVIPPTRLARLKAEINRGDLPDFRKIMSMSYAEWRAEILTARYDQAWSMIHFLVHGDSGRYVRALSSFIDEVSSGRRWEEAWVRNFGRNTDAFQERWRRYWLGRPADPTRELYEKAVVAVMTSFFARAVSQRQRFENFEGFMDAARAGELKAHEQDWLPPRLLTEALRKADGVGAWSIENSRHRLPRLVCHSRSGAEFTGRFDIRAGRVRRVIVDVAGKAQPASAPAR